MIMLIILDMYLLGKKYKDNIMFCLHSFNFLKEAVLFGI